MEAVADTVGALADRPDRDIRLEAAAAKEWNTERGWMLSDLALQIRGGRGYEREDSLSARGEPGIGIERMLRDARINRIFEGSSEIMHLFIAREAVDKHLSVAGGLIDPELPIGKKLSLLPKVALFYVLWYPRQWFGGWFGYSEYGRLGGYMRFAARASRRLARGIFHGMLRFGPKLERKQGFLFRAVDVALELFALTASVLRAHSRPSGQWHAAEDVADLFARGAVRRIDAKLRALWRNDDVEQYALAQAVLAGDHTWLESGTIGLPYSVDDLRPESMEQILAARARRPLTEASPAANHEERPSQMQRKRSAPSVRRTGTH